MKFSNVIKEPMMKEAIIRDGYSCLHCRVVGTDAPSHIHQNRDAVLSSAVEE